LWLHDSNVHTVGHKSPFSNYLVTLYALLDCDSVLHSTPDDITVQQRYTVHQPLMPS